MARTVRRVVLVLVLAAVAGGVALALTARPDLDRAREAAESRWRALRQSLGERYTLLAGATEAVRDAGGPPRLVVADLDVALARWREARQGGAVDSQVRAANTLEGLGRRLAGVVAASPRLTGDGDVVRAIEAFSTHELPEAARAFDAAVRDYEEERDSLLRRAVAGLLGYDALPALDLGAAAAGA